MKTTGYRLLLLVVGLLVLGASLSPASAQEKDKKEVKKELIVKVDDEGNITINGEPAEEGEITMPDGSKMIVDKKGGRVIVIEDEDGKVIRRKLQAPEWDDDDENFFILESDDDGEHKIIKRRIRVPEVEHDVQVMLERLGEGPHGVLKWRSGDDENVWTMRTPAPMFLDKAFDFDFDFDFEHANPEIVKKEAETRKLAREIMEAEANEKAELERDLSAKLNEIFDMKLESRQKRVEQLQKRLEKEQAELRERQSARSEIIERRKDALLGDDRLEW